MAKKTKYDILNKELKAVNKNILSLAFTAITLSAKLESDAYTEEEKEEMMAKMAKKFLPFVKILSHIGYENSRDLKSIDEQTINDYLKSKRISKEDFLKGYEAKQAELIAILALFAVADKEGIDILTLENPLSFIDWFNGDLDEFDIYELENSTYYPLLEEVFDEEFKPSNMSEELKTLIDDYHTNYMESIIYPQVTQTQLKDKDILKISKANIKKIK